MIDKDLLYKNNIIIIDFLDLKPCTDKKTGEVLYELEMDINASTLKGKFSIDGLYFHCDWNWFLWLWDYLHRKVIIPMVRDNPHLRRQINEQIKDMKSCLKWVRLESAYLTLVKLIEYYNNQFDYRA